MQIRRALLNPGIVSELEWAKAFVLGAHPRVLCAHSSENKVVMFTDAFLAEDDTLAGIGMVAYAVRQGRVAKKFYMSERVPPDVLKEMQSVTSKVIAALELYAAVASVELLAEELRGRRAFIFVDNEAARANLISMSSGVEVHAKLLRRLSHLSSKSSLFIWVSRVPSASNIADKPSRFDTAFLQSAGFVQLIPDWCMQGP